MGEIQDLKVINANKDGVILEHGIELPNGTNKVGESLAVFIYKDGDEVKGSLQKPLIRVGGFATLTVTEINMVGAFCDIGIEKELFIPYSNQTKDMIPDRRYVVHMYLDELTNRLVGTAKIKRFLVQEAGDELKFGQKVDIIVYAESNLGYTAVVNQKYDGLIYESDLMGEILRHGEERKAYIKQIREDRKIDLSLTPVGHKSIEPNAQKILELLQKAHGFLPFNDKSDPISIRETFGISKKLFKKSIGGLYKDRMIDIKTDGIHLR